MLWALVARAAWACDAEEAQNTAEAKEISWLHLAWRNKVEDKACSDDINTL